MLQFFDTLVLDGARKTRDGYLAGVAKSARTGIQLYTAGELGLTDRQPSEVVRVYRAPEQVFARDALASMAYRPVTLNHPPEMVDSKNWRQYSVGTVGSEIVRDGEIVSVPMVLMDQTAIDRYEAGTRELSWGYTCDLDFTAGKSPQGEAYDAQQVGISTNHLALCDNARGGSSLRFGDRSSTPEPERPHTMTDRTIVVDGIGYQLSDQGAQLVGRLQSLLATAGAALTDAQATHAAAIAAKDTELGQAAAKLADAEAKVVTGAALDALVADRAGIVAKAKAMGLTDAAITGKTNDEIKRAAVALRATDAALVGKSAEYVGALFDHAATGAKTPTQDQNDPLRLALGDQTVTNQDAAATAYTGMVADMESAWKSPAGGAKH